jgi:hypothetical protein
MLRGRSSGTGALSTRSSPATSRRVRRCSSPSSRARARPPRASLAARRGVEEIVCLGDLAAGGPQPHEVIATVRELGCQVVRGNADRWLLEGLPPGRSAETRRLGDVADRRSGASRSNADGRASPSPSKPKPSAQPAGCTIAGTRSRPEASPARSSWSPSPASSPDTAGHSRPWSSRNHQQLGEESAPAQRREERPERTL